MTEKPIVETTKSVRDEKTKFVANEARNKAGSLLVGSDKETVMEGGDVTNV